MEDLAKAARDAAKACDELEQCCRANDVKGFRVLSKKVVEKCNLVCDMADHTLKDAQHGTNDKVAPKDK